VSKKKQRHLPRDVGYHYKSCAEGSADGLSNILSEVYAAMMGVSLDAGYYPERWKEVIDVMLEKIQGVARSDKLRIIRLLETYLNQVL
jgi:hypothetical protein